MSRPTEWILLDFAPCLLPCLIHIHSYISVLDFHTLCFGHNHNRFCSISKISEDWRGKSCQKWVWAPIQGVALITRCVSASSEETCVARTERRHGQGRNIRQAMSWRSNTVQGGSLPLRRTNSVILWYEWMIRLVRGCKRVGVLRSVGDSLSCW